MLVIHETDRVRVYIRFADGDLVIEVKENNKFVEGFSIELRSLYEGYKIFVGKEKENDYRREDEEVFRKR